eukprot:scaffold1216_cov357-Prasinococcus_capsulatus_cf.AAC.15
MACNAARARGRHGPGVTCRSAQAGRTKQRLQQLLRQQHQQQQHQPQQQHRRRPRHQGVAGWSTGRGDTVSVRSAGRARPLEHASSGARPRATGA